MSTIIPKLRQGDKKIAFTVQLSDDTKHPSEEQWQRTTKTLCRQHPSVKIHHQPDSDWISIGKSPKWQECGMNLRFAW